MSIKKLITKFIIAPVLVFAACQSDSNESDITTGNETPEYSCGPLPTEYTSMESTPSVLSYDSIKGFLIEGVPVDSFDIESFMKQRKNPLARIPIDPIEMGTDFVVRFSYKEVTIMYSTPSLSKVPVRQDDVHITLNYYLPGKVMRGVKYSGHNSGSSYPYMLVSVGFKVEMDNGITEYETNFIAEIRSNYVYIY